MRLLGIRSGDGGSPWNGLTMGRSYCLKELDPSFYGKI